MKKRTSKRNSKKNSSFFSGKLFSTKNLIRVGTAVFLIVLAYGIYSIFSDNSDYQADSSMQVEVQDISNYIIQNYSNGINLAVYQTYKPGVISIPLNGSQTRFNILSSKRAEYVKSNSTLAMKIWVEAVLGTEYPNYKSAMLEEINSFSNPSVAGAVPLSSAVPVEYNGHEYYLSYKPSTVFNLLCSDCWFGSGKVFFPERNVSVTVSFFKPIGQTYSQAVNNSESVLKELIDKS